MSFMPGSEPRDLLALAGGVAALFGSLQLWSVRERGKAGQVVSECADGSVIGAWNAGVRRRAPRFRVRGFPARGPAFAGAGTARRRAVREDLEPGDLSFLRLRWGRPGEAEWVVEGADAGRDPYRLHWEFDSAAPALAAYRLLDERILRPPLDTRGREVALSDLEFDALMAGGQYLA